MRILAFALLSIMAGAHASSLQFCPASQPPFSGAQAIVTSANGTPLRIGIGESPAPGCHSIPLPVPVADVVAVHPLAAPIARRIDDSLIVQGVKRDKAFNISLVTPAAEREQPARRPMPLQENLLAGMSVRPYGVEERVQASLADGRLHLRCEAGTKPAGIILSGFWYMTQARVSLRLSATGNGRFEVGMADAAGVAKETAAMAGYIDAGAAAPAELALPSKGVDRATWRQFSFTCPYHQSELVLHDARLVPDAQPAGDRATWIWQPRQWIERPDRLLGHAQQHGIRTFFVAVPIIDGKVDNPERLAAFVRRARASGIDVWSVDGDPRMVLPGEHAATIARVRAYAAYNRDVDPSARLLGMQFDIEHYLLPGYATAAGELDQHYLALARSLRTAAGETPLEFVVPFWWSDKTELLRGLARTASALNVMDYRTQPAQIREFAIPFLDWGVKHGKKVRIALEAGPVDAELQERYVKADNGEAWLVTLERMPVLVLLKNAQANPYGPAFRRESSTVLDGSATTFSSKPDQLREMLPSLESYFSAWPSFNGMALHGLN